MNWFWLMRIGLLLWWLSVFTVGFHVAFIFWPVFFIGWIASGEFNQIGRWTIDLFINKGDGRK